MKTEFINFNNHPSKLRTGDCVVRAISKALDKDYLETRRDLNRVKRELGAGSYKRNDFLYKYLNNYERLKFKAEKGVPRLKGKDFKKLHPKGTYILSMAKHFTVYIDGAIYDSWDCREKTVYTAWRIK